MQDDAKSTVFDTKFAFRVRVNFSENLGEKCAKRQQNVQNSVKNTRFGPYSAVSTCKSLFLAKRRNPTEIGQNIAENVQMNYKRTQKTCYLAYVFPFILHIAFFAVKRKMSLAECNTTLKTSFLTTDLSSKQKVIILKD